MRIKRVYIAILLATLWLWPGICPAAEPDDLAPPPADYRRSIEVRIRDVFDRPLSGVTLDIQAAMGSLDESTPLISDDSGLIRFDLRPVIEDPNRDLRIRDRFLLYKTQFDYILNKNGFFKETGRVSDVQEFAAFADPLFQGMNRLPTDRPFQIKAVMAQVSDFPASANDAVQVTKFIENLYENGRTAGFGLLPGSFALRPDGRLAFGLDFHPLFDPAVYGQIEAGRAMLKDPIRAALRVLRSMPDLNGRVKMLEISIRARFQFTNHPYPEPAKLVYLIQAPGSFSGALTDWTPDQPLPLDNVSILAGGRMLNLAIGASEAKAHGK